MSDRQLAVETKARIWTDDLHRAATNGTPADVEYVRADIADALLAALEAALPELEYLEAYMGSPDSDHEVARTANAEVVAVTEQVRAAIAAAREATGGENA